MENILASVNPLNCTLRLRQLTSGNPNLTDDSPKLDRIKEMLEEEIIPNGHKAIIFSQWSTIAKDLGIELSEYDPIVITGEVHPEQRQKLVDNFQTNPQCKVAIGTIGAMGTGLTLNKASYVFFMDKAWNSGDNAQAEDRAHRIGTVGAVNVISMVAKGTIDEAVEDYLLENKDLIDRVVDGKGSKQDIKPSLTNYLAFNIQVWYNNSKRRYIMRAITVDADTGKRIYTRKEVADLVGASTQSIRLWEDAGAIPASVRDEGGYRYWYEEDLEAIKAYASLPRKAKLKK